MADEDYRWLDGEAAERLLRGEPLEAVDADTKERVERLAEALASLAEEPAPDGAELPGEDAALAAFRAARAGRGGVPAGRAAGPDVRAAARAADAGLVRLGGPGAGGHRARWGRPVRFGLAAALAVGMVGGVAVAAGTGVLPTPFRDDRPHPAATVSAAQTPRPLDSPSPGVSQADGSEVPLPGATTSGPAGSGSSDDLSAGGSASGGPGSSGPDRPLRSHEWWTRTRSSCQDVLGGKNLEAGRRRVLTDAAGGGGRVKTFCRRVLGWTGTRSGQGGDDRGGQAGQGDGRNGSGSGHGSGHGSGGGNQGDDGGHPVPGGNGHHHSGVFAPAAPSALATLSPRTSALSSAVRDAARADGPGPRLSAV
ncbi:hypothetical protein EAO69_16795 [Streptomyces sp. me109]|uniref:hypothetical protein n=2 Tax=unclassified Streptomyces TaxID=2593676 RepID=UPI0011CD703F|nr:hypothetical protein [Streptomyces sp. me109]TXS72870.1 hypothetical protein EAO69_16795 [Streptomyces sp. me109]